MCFLSDRSVWGAGGGVPQKRGDGNGGAGYVGKQVQFSSTNAHCAKTMKFANKCDVYVSHIKQGTN